MPKLLLIAGPSGSGKSRVAEYAARECEAARYSIDEWMLNLAGSFDWHIGPVMHALPHGDEFWNALPNLGYTWRDALQTVEKYAEQLGRKEDIPEAEKYKIGSVLFGNYLASLNATLSVKNVAQEAGPGMSRIFVLAACDEKYILELEVKPEVAAARKAKQRKITEEIAAERYEKTKKFIAPAPPELKRYWKRENNTEEDLEIIEADLRELFGE